MALSGGIRSLGMGALLLLATACQRPDAGLPLAIEISQQVGAEPLQLQKTYALPASQELRVDRLRYYLSQFRLHRADGQWQAAAQRDSDDLGYFLVDAADPASQKLQLQGLQAGQYDGIEFLIGVDAARNHQGAQTGALDPARGMFWTWNTGYIFFKLEGQSPQSGAPSQSVTWHIGGTQPLSLSHKVYLPTGSKPLRLDDKIAGTVHLVFDLAAVFAAAPALALKDHNSIMEPKDGVVVADHVAQAFRLDHLHQEPRP